MDIHGTMHFMYEVLRTKEDRALMKWEDERGSMMAQFEILRAENATQAAIIKHQQVEFDNLMQSVTGFSTISASSVSSNRNFLASVPKSTRQQTTPKDKETPTSHNKRSRELNPDEEPDFISIDHSKTSKKGPMHSFFSSEASTASSSSTVKGKSSKSSEGLELSKKTGFSVQKKLTKSNSNLDDAWLHESIPAGTTSASVCGSGEGGKVPACIEDAPATSSSTSTVPMLTIPIHALHEMGVQKSSAELSWISSKAEACADMDTQWLGLSGNPVNPTSSPKHVTTTAPTAHPYIVVPDSVEADPRQFLSQDDNVTVAALSQSQEEHPLLSQEHPFIPPPDSQATCASQHGTLSMLRSHTDYNYDHAPATTGVYRDRRVSITLPHASPSQTQSQLLYSQEINIHPTATSPEPHADKTDDNIATNNDNNINDEETNVNEEDGSEDFFFDLVPKRTPLTPARVPKESLRVPTKEEIIDLSHSPNKENKRKHSTISDAVTGSASSDICTKGSGVYSKHDVLQDVSNMLPPQGKTTARKSKHTTTTSNVYDTTHAVHTEPTTHTKRHTHIPPAAYTTHTTPAPTGAYTTTSAANAAANRLVTSFTDLSPELALHGAVKRVSVGGDVHSAYIDRLVVTHSASNVNTVANNVSNAAQATTSANNARNSDHGDSQYDLSAIVNNTHSTHSTNTANTSKHNKLSGSFLSKKQQQALKLWLEAYRQKWVTYWNHLSNNMISEIVRTVPVTMDELAAVPGMAWNKVSQDGEGILCTIYAYLEHSDLLHLFPHAVLPSLPECPTWRSPLSEAAETARTAEEQRRQRDRYGWRGDDIKAPTTAHISGASSSSSKTNASTTNSTTSTTNSTKNLPTNPTTTTTTTNATSAGGAGRSTYNTSKCIETVRSKEQRAALPGFTCEECSRFYETMQHQGIMCMTDSQMRREVLQACSRHKARWTPPSTPEGFWGLTLHTPDDWK